ncbi:MAG TPA: 5-(carboxyamino)imidazole ribonucleotide mutase [Candidatus Hydrogenedentes bacterium]|mgnify:FL=1|nr:5-(carboxyamino)imidazole ribonucleotide mutase [Candidatus Hydrogenedentota bacterium]HRZ81431.1 5-(carboxyamino)imidazole ribonucleotide mutase [Candidatus Hydrogenedentota bacterium]
MNMPATPLVVILMGSESDWETMRRAHKTLAEFGVPHESRVLSAHRTPDLVAEYVRASDANGAEVFIAGAGMAAALPGVVAALTTRPVLGVPVASGPLNGQDALHAIVQMPPGIPVGTLAIGGAGATNAALLAVAILANKYPVLAERLAAYRAAQAEKIQAITLPED